MNSWTESDMLFNIREFGAAGDGVSDDTQTIQHCIDEAAKVQGVVLIPPGRYLCGELRLRSGVALEGSATFSFRTSRGSILQLRSDRDSRCMLNLTGAYGARVAGLCLVGRGKEDLCTVHGIMIDKEDYGKEEDTPVIDGCRVERFSGDGIHLSRIWCFSVRHSHLFANAGNGLFVRGWDGFVIDNWMSGNGKAGYGAYQENASVTMTGNRIEWNAGGGIVIHHGSHYNLTGNYIDRSGRVGIDLLGARIITASGNVIYRSGKPEWGLETEIDSAHCRMIGCSGVTFCANTMTYGRDDGGKGEFSPLFGIVLRECTDSVVKDNTLASAALKELIHDDGGHHNCVIKDNPGSLASI